MKDKVVAYKAVHATAIQLLEQGKADEGMQKLALDWIIKSVCMTYDQAYIPNDTHETAFNEGRRYCGNTIVKMLKLEPGKVRSKE